MGAGAIIGGIFDVLGGAESYEDERTKIEARMSQIGSDKRVLARESSRAAESYGETTEQQKLRELGFESSRDIVGYKKDKIGTARGRLDLAGGRLDLQESRLGVAEEGIGLERKSLGVAGRRLDIQEDLLGKQAGSARRGAQIQKGLLASEVRVAETQRLGQMAQRAFASKDLKLGLAAETQKARIESSRAKMLNAGAGASAFSRAYTSTKINERSSYEQKQTGLKLEGLISESIFSERMAQSGLRGEEIDRQLLASLDEVNARLDTLDTQRDDIAISGERLGLKQQGIELDRLGLDIDRADIDLSRDDLDTDYRLAGESLEQIDIAEDMSQSQQRETVIDFYAGQDIRAEQGREMDAQYDYLAEQLDDGIYGDIMAGFGMFDDEASGVVEGIKENLPWS